MQAGQHLLVIATPARALRARAMGWVLRDTLAIELPGPRLLTAYLFRVPFEGTVAELVMATGQGALWVDACRTGRNPGEGRWPTNLLLVHEGGCRQEGTKRVRGSHDTTGVWGKAGSERCYAGGWQRDPTERRHSYTTGDGTEMVAHWECASGCPVALLEDQSRGKMHSAGSACTGTLERSGKGQGVFPIGGRVGTRFGDRGGASRFYPQLSSLQEVREWLNRLVGAAV